MDLAALLALAARLAELDDAELSQLLTDLRAAAEERADAPPSDETLAELHQIRDSVAAVSAEVGSREEAAAEREAQMAEALAAIRAQDEGTGDESTNDEADAGEPDAAAPPPEPPAPEPAEPEANLPVAAAAAPRVGRVAARRPTPTQQRPAVQQPNLSGLVASANLSDFQPGESLDDPERFAQAFASALRSTRAYRGGTRIKVPVAVAGRENAEEIFGADRFLSMSDWRGNTRRVNAAQAKVRAGTPISELTSMTAAGGICAPQQVRYDQPVIGTDARPVRDQAMMRFGADRGGIQTLPPPVLSDMDGGVEVWTEANDTTPGSDGPATKPCLVVTCPTEDETLVEAITQCLEFGLFRERYFPEQIEAWRELLAVRHARLAEVELLTAIGAGSTDVDVGQGLGTTRDVLAALDRATAAWISRHRLAPTQPFRWAAPFWLRSNMRADLAREVPGATAERLATADAAIDAFFAARNINTTWFLDGETGQIFDTPQGVGPLVNWPTEVVTYLYLDGTWLFLDGGEFRVGIIRDSSLIETNDARFFAETFEGAHFHGVESQRLTLDICPSGASSAAVDFDPCAFGS